MNGLEKSITSSRTKVIVKGATATSALWGEKKKDKMQLSSVVLYSLVSLFTVNILLRLKGYES